MVSLSSPADEALLDDNNKALAAVDDSFHSLFRLVRRNVFLDADLRARYNKAQHTRTTTSEILEQQAWQNERQRLPTESLASSTYLMRRQKIGHTRSGRPAPPLWIQNGGIQTTVGISICHPSRETVYLY